MEISKYLLFPLTLLYSAAIHIRNMSYDRGFRISVKFETNLICIGNLEVGGTGKTPMIEYLIRLLSKEHKLATLSRGYKRKSKGFRIANATDDASTIGDEPFQLYSKFRNQVTVAVGINRETAIPFILADHPETKVILLDDAFQYRTVDPQLSIILTRFSRPFYSDMLLPSGRLREYRAAAGRADLIVVTKCPEDLGDDLIAQMRRSIQKYTDAPIFFSSVTYQSPIPIDGEIGTFSENIILVSGIAHSEGFENHANANYNVILHFKFADHHSYSRQQIEEIIEIANSNKASILMTDKDATKWINLGIDVSNAFSLPIQTVFLKDGTQFDELILSSLKDYELPY